MADDEIRHAEYSQNVKEPLHGPRISYSDQERVIAICENCGKYANDRKSIDMYHSELLDVLKNTKDLTPSASSRIRSDRGVCLRERNRSFRPKI